LEPDKPILSPHIQDTVRSIAGLHVAHERRTSPYQRTIARLIDQLSEAASAGMIAAIMLVWIGVNVLLPHLHMQPFDRPPFSYLEDVLAAAAFFMTVLILTSQRHENRLAEHRSQLTLELAMVSEQKISKLIALVERQRRDNPQLENRVDEEAIAMARPADSQEIFEAIRETHHEMIAEACQVVSETEVPA
jgi:uncharacterized membrane protein